MDESNPLVDPSPRASRGPDTPTPADPLAQVEINGVPIVDLFRTAPSGDYRAHVELVRALIALSQEPATLSKFAADSRRAVEQMHGPRVLEKTRQRFLRKDTINRFSELQEERRRIIDAQPSLLSGADFDECLTQYKALIEHVESLWADACSLYLRENFPLATFLSILAIEEVGKLTNLYIELVFFDLKRPTPQPRSVDGSHKRKQLIGVFSGALVNARLDRVLGFDVVRKLLNMAQSNGIEQIRQDCLYIDVHGGRVVTPRERIGPDRARDLTVFTGEVMAEVLGHFPWDFERMLDSVIAFERSIGLPEKKIERR